MMTSRLAQGPVARMRALAVLTLPTLVLASLVFAVSAQGASADAVTPSLAPEAASLPEITHGRVLLKLKAGVELRAVAERTGLQLEKVRSSILGWQLVAVGGIEAADPSAVPTAADALAGKSTWAAIAALDHDPGVVHAQGERIYQALAVPNDPYFDQMWHLEAIGVEAAWDHTTGQSTQRVGVVDTGTRRNHVELVDKDIMGWDFITDSWQAGDNDGRDADYTDEGDAATCGGSQRPNSWHGSHVAGTVLASTNNEIGIAGINHAAGLVTARALGKCGGSLVDIMEGAAWLAGYPLEGPPAIGEDRATVLNLSLGGSGPCSYYEQEILDWIDDQGTVVVAASGNDGGAVNSPANCGNVITVAASSPTGGLTNYSSFDSSVEVVAPGGQMWSAQEQAVLSLAGPADDAFQWSQGTSMAAPHVTGAISLIQDMNPNLTRLQIVQILADTGAACAGCLGKPRIQLDEALDFVSTGQLPVPPPDDYLQGNDSPAHAAEISCGQSYDLIMIPGGEDWFTFTADPGLLVTVDVVAATEFDIDMYLYTEAGVNEIGRSTTPSGVESVRAAAPDAPLHLGVLSWDGAAGDYGMSVTCEDLDDHLEPNNRPDEAAPLSCYSELDLYMAPGDRDWFLLDVDPGEPFDLSITALGDDILPADEVDLDLYITQGGTQDDIVAESTSPTGEELVNFQRDQNSGAQQLWAVVLPFRRAAGPYHLSFTCPDRPVPEEPDPTEELPTETTDPGIEEPTDPNLVPDELPLVGGCNHTRPSATGAAASWPGLALVVVGLSSWARRRRRSGVGDTSDPR